MSNVGIAWFCFAVSGLVPVAVFGILGYGGFLTHLSADFEDMAGADVFRPQRFMCTWGIHLRGYLGGFLGTAVAAALLLRKRARLMRMNAK